MIGHVVLHVYLILWFLYCVEAIWSSLLMLMMIICGRKFSPKMSPNNVKSGDECLLGVEDEAKACFNLLVEFAIA